MKDQLGTDFKDVVINHEIIKLLNNLKIEIDNNNPLKLIKRDKINSTRDVHTFLECIKKYNVQFANFSIYINQKNESTKPKNKNQEKFQHF